MKSYIVCFNICGKSIKVRLEAPSPLEAKQQVINSIIFDDIVDILEEPTILSRFKTTPPPPSPPPIRTIREGELSIQYLRNIFGMK